MGCLEAKEYFEPELGVEQIVKLEKNISEDIMRELKNLEPLEVLLDAGVFRDRALNVVTHFLDTQADETCFEHDSYESTSIQSTLPKTATKINLNAFKYAS